MITNEHAIVRCPQCSSELKEICKYNRFDIKSRPNIHICKNCDMYVLSWRIFIIRERGGNRRDLFVPTSNRATEFIESARTSGRFNEEKLFVLSEKELLSYKSKLGNKHLSETGIVIEAFNRLHNRKLN